MCGVTIVGRKRLQIHKEFFLILFKIISDNRGRLQIYFYGLWYFDNDYFESAARIEGRVYTGILTERYLCTRFKSFFHFFFLIFFHFFRILKALTSECRTLKNVSIMNSPFLSDAAFKCLASCKKLNKIRVEGEFNLSFSESFHLEKFLIEYA